MHTGLCHHNQSLSMRPRESWITSLVINSLAILQYTYPSKNENPLLPQPEPSVTSVKTHLALCLLGVRTKRAIQIATEATTKKNERLIVHRKYLKSLPLIGANQRMILCRFLVPNEQIIPNRQSIKIVSRTVCHGLLIQTSAGDFPWWKNHFADLRGE